MKEGVRPTSPVSAAEEPIVFVIDDDPLMLGGLSCLFRSMSSGCPLRPSGVLAIVAFSKSLPMMPPLCVPSVSTPPGWR